MTNDGEAGWRWRNVPVPAAHFTGLVAGAVIGWLRPWGLPLDGPLASVLGVALLVDLPWALVLLPAVLVVVHWQVGREKRALERRFGDEYRRYRHAVRRYL